REKAVPDDAPEENRQANRDSLCGTRRAWYAPGVGLVQLSAVDASGAEERLQLQEHALQGGSDAYLPLEVGNRWTYGWADLPDAVKGKEVFDVAAQEGETWTVESYGYLLPPVVR